MWALGQCAEAQGQGLNFVNFSSNNGLSSNTVNAVLKDRWGYMWFATEDGLTRFDGASFKVYNHNDLDSLSIGANQLQSIYEDPGGNLWVGTNRTLALYDRGRDCFHNFDVSHGTAIRSMCAGDSGRLWIGCYSGLVSFDPATRRTRFYMADSSRPRQLLTNTVICVFRDSRRRLWAGTNRGLYLYQPGTDDFRRMSNTANDPDALSDSVVKSMAEDGNGRLWVGTNSGGLDLLQADGAHFTRFTTNRSDPRSLSSNRIYAIDPDGAGKLWIGTEEGLNIFDPATHRVDRVAGNDRARYSLKGTTVHSIYIDPHGIYWIGTVQGGVNKYDKNLPFFNMVGYNPFDPMGLSCPKVTSFAEGDHGDIFIGTDGGGLNLFHRTTGLSEHVALPYKGKGGGLRILSLERNGREIWIGTFQYGVYILDLVDKRVRHLVKGDGPEDLPSDEVFCVTRDRRGDMWIGTNGGGVCMYDPRRRVIRRFPVVRGDGISSSMLGHAFIRAIEEDDEGNILIGTVGVGLLVFDPARNSCKAFNRSNTNLPLDEAITVQVGRAGIVWVGTPGGGLCRLDIPRNDFSHFSEQQGLASPVVNKVMEDTAGKLWISTNKGISCFTPSSYSFKNYTSENGLPAGAFNLGSGMVASDGELYFGSVEGFSYFSPGALRDNRNIPGIVFTDLKIGGRSVVPGPYAAIEKNIAQADLIRLDYKQNFSVDFAALDYTTPGDDRYMYRLDGLDKSWNQLGAGRTAVFTNLYPGEYTLEVVARNGNGDWKTQPAKMKIVVMPPFWLTGYAYVFYILLLALLLWGIRYRGIRKLKATFALEQERLRMRQQIEQERREAERVHEFDQLKIKFLTNLSHELRTPISLIIGPIDKLNEMEADPDRRRQLTRVKRNARRLLNLVNQLLDFRKLEDRELKLDCTQGDLIPFVREAAESFRDIAERKQIHFTFRSTVACYYTTFDRDKIERILFNLLGNAFKFTGKGGQIALEVRPAHPGITIIVSDTGVGMSGDEQERIFDRFFQGNVHTGIMNQGSGIGLSITREFVRLHGGSISVESTLGKGSVFTVLLPFDCIQGAGSEVVIHESLPRQDELPVSAEPLAPAPRGRLTVLVVEDNDDFRSYLKDNLRPGYKVIEASDGKEGWQKAISRHPDIILCDISMPEMNGIELSRKIKSDKRVSHIPVILLTALTEDTFQLRGLETGASDYLTKPFSFEILHIKIHNLVMLSQRLKETYTRRLAIETPPVQVASADEQLILRVTQFIEANLDNSNLSVEEVSKHLFMSHASLYRKIVDLTGETPVEFIRSVRLAKAADMLEGSSLKIAEIGYAVGFTSPNYFTRAFKAKYNLAPSEYASARRNPIS
jgi:signal transduction histidine kinase/ligand-binding sensor domain-containing protein/DNA-binding response OmpR family regulator